MHTSFLAFHGIAYKDLIHSWRGRISRRRSQIERDPGNLILSPKIKQAVFSRLKLLVRFLARNDSNWWRMFKTIREQELDEMKKRLKEIEDEAAALREMHAKVEKDMGPQDPATLAADLAGKEEVDARYVFVGNGPLQHTQSMSGLKDITESSNSRESFSSGTHPGR
ncbi:unnamed protein product [Brassica oleracea var. botrytis]